MFIDLEMEKNIWKRKNYAIFAEMNNQEALKFNNFITMGV